MEAEGGLEKKDFFEKHFPISSSVTPALELCDTLQLSLKYPPLQYSSSAEYPLQYSNTKRSPPIFIISWHKMEKYECILDEIGNLTRWPHCEDTGAQKKQ